MWVEADVADQAHSTSAVAATVDAVGGIDIVIANAGYRQLRHRRTADPEEFARTIAVNLVGVPARLSRLCATSVDSRGYVLLVASVASFMPLPGGAAYAASKAGVESLGGVACGSSWRSTAWPSGAFTHLGRHRHGQGTKTALPAFKRMRDGLPWPANS